MTITMMVMEERPDLCTIYSSTSVIYNMGGLFCFQFLEEKQERSSGLGCDDRFRSDVMLWPSTRTFFIFYFFNGWTHFTHLVRASDEQASKQPTRRRGSMWRIRGYCAIREQYISFLL